jgi:hypothetical protein
MLLLPSLMTENNILTSEQRLLTTNWKELFPLTSQTKKYTALPGTGPNLHHLREEKTEEKRAQIRLPSENP